MNLKTSNRKRKFSLRNFLKLFIKLNEEFKTNGSDSFFCNIVSLFFYFSHLMSYLIHYDTHSEEDQKFHIFANIIFFTNPANIIIYVGNDTFSIIMYTITVCLILFISLYVPFLMISKKIWRSDIDQSKFFSFLNYLFVFWLNTFFWCLLKPSLDLMLKAILCEEKNSNFLNNKMVCFGNQFLISFFSIVAALLIHWVEFLNLILNENFLFLEKTTLNMNKIRISHLLLFGLRVMINCFSIFYNDSKNLIHLGVHLFFLFSLMDYLQLLPFRNPNYNKFYLGLILCCELFAFLLSSFEFFFVVDAKSFFFSFFPIALMLIKLASKIFERENNYYYFLSENEKIKNYDYLLEEILYLFEKENSSQECYFILVGLLRKISKHKEKKHLELKNSILKNEYHNLSSKDRYRISSNYVKENFHHMIYSKLKSEEEIREIEISILKYISFLLKGNVTILKTFFEYLKIRSIIMNPSMLFEIKSEIMLDQIRFKIYKIQSEIKKSNQNLSTDETMILASDFFYLDNKRKTLQRKLSETISSKMDFYEKLNNGFDNYDEMLSKLNSSVKKINILKKHLDIAQDIIALKFYSIFNCIILNFLPLALKNEEDIENIKKKYYRYEHEKLTPNLIFSPSITIFQISFLNEENKILESSKTESLANFFGFSRSELSSISTLNLLMPDFIAKSHRKIVENSFEKSRKASYKDNVSVLAINKNGFCFPIQVFFSNCFEYDNDFVFNTMVRKKVSFHNHIILADSDCLISNVSEETFKFLKFSMFNLNPSDLNFFKLYHLIPETKEFLTEESFNQKSIKIFQKEGVLLIPQFIDEIIEVLRIKSQLLFYYQENLKTSTSSQSFRSLKSMHSDNKRRGCDKLLNDFISKNSSLSQKFEGTLVEWMKDNNLQPSDLLTNFYELLDLREFKIVFNFEMKIVYLDEAQTQKNSLQFIELHIEKLDEENKDGSIISDSKINFFGLPTHRHTKININFPNLKAESNHNVNFQTSECLIESDFRNNLDATRRIKLEFDAQIKDSVNSKNDGEEDREKRVSSNRESSVGRSTQNMNIIEIQKKLLDSFPFSIYLMYFLFFIQLIIVFLFALLIFLFLMNYLENDYYPLHETMIEQANINLAFRYGGIILTQNELEYRGLIQRDDFTKHKQNEILQNFTISAMTTLQKFRDQDRNFLYEKHLQSSITKYLDLRAQTIKNITFSDLMDALLENMNYFINRSSINDDKVTKFCGRNLPYYLEASKVSRDLVQLEFLDSKTLISSQLTDVLVVVCVLVFVIKICEFFNFLQLQKKLVQLMNISLRITQHESRKELLFLRETLSKAKNAVFSFLSFSYTEHLLKKEEIYEGEKNSKNFASDKLSNSKKKKLKNMNMRAFSKKGLCIYLSFTLILIFLYYTINYVFLIKTEDKINELISFNIMINNLNLYTGNIVGLALFQMRDKLLMEKEYDKLNEDLQNLNFRQKFYYGRFTGRILDLKLYVHSIPSQFTEAKANLDDSFKDLVNGDVCGELLKIKELELDCYSFCRKAFNGGFNKGIIGALNEYLNFVNQVEEYVKPRNNDDASIVLKENQKIIKLLNESDYKNIVVESFILLKALRVFLNIMKDYYIKTLKENIINLEIINLVSCLITFIIFALFASSWVKKIKSSYRDCVWGLGLIPYEKIINDEQTNFLIKQFNKEI